MATGKDTAATNLPADSAQAREAIEEGKARIEFRGESYTVPASVEDWSIDALDHYEGGRSVQFVRELLSTEEYERLRKQAKTVRDLEEFAKLVRKAGGMERRGE